MPASRFVINFSNSLKGVFDSLRRGGLPLYLAILPVFADINFCIRLAEIRIYPAPKLGF